MVAETGTTQMSDLNKIRTNRLADALRVKNASDLGRSQSMRHRPTDSLRVESLVPPSNMRPASRSPMKFRDGSFDSYCEFRNRSRTLPSEEIQCQWAANHRPINLPLEDTKVAAPLPEALTPEEEEEREVVVERMRTFTLDPEHATVVNRGDSFRCRSNTGSTGIRGRRSLNESSKNSSALSSRSHSPVGPIESINQAEFVSQKSEDIIRKYHIIVLGSAGVGKTSMINQFMTSDYCNPFQNESSEVPEENTVSVLLDHEESQMTFIEVNNEKSDMWLSLSAAGYIVAYSVDDLASFRNAEAALNELRQTAHTSTKPVILVANKIDLERKRVVSVDDGKQLAKECNCKFVEIAVALDHHVDALLVGVLAQSRINESAEPVYTSSGSKSELVAAFDSTFPSMFHPQGRSSSGSSSGSAEKKHKPRAKNKNIEKSHSLKKLDGAESSGCSHFAAVRERFIRRLFGKRRRSHSLEDLLAFQRRKL